MSIPHNIEKRLLLSGNSAPYRGWNAHGTMYYISKENKGWRAVARGNAPSIYGRTLVEVGAKLREDHS